MRLSLALCILILPHLSTNISDGEKGEYFRDFDILLISTTTGIQDVSHYQLISMRAYIDELGTDLYAEK